MSMKKFALAAVFAVAATPVMAAECSAVVESNDQMQYNTKEIVVSKACKTFDIELKHVGSMPKAAMGHNIVVSKEADVTGIATDGAAAGPDANYIKADDARVIAHTKLIGGGESDKLTLDPATLSKDDAYTFFCSFPGHIAMMKGTVKVTD
ncbi:azurin [Pelistega indica]|uniref:Azurin n=1 Tax=Pelistega indica TaxID=1414851 RepID=V8G051_9BURK|nr:azurin [Pelistega indica]ETD69338.1 azurin [Pelistega indica]